MSATRTVAPFFTRTGVAAMSLDRRPQARGEREVLLARLGEPPDRLQLVLGLERVGDVRDRQARSGQLRRIEDDFDLARVAREHLDRVRRPARARAPAA